MMYKSLYALVMIILLGTMGTVSAANIKEGRDAFETCRGCHSTPGYSNVYPTYYVPKIGGQVPAYIASALKSYKESGRSHRTMMANCFDLSEKTIENIAAYLSEIKDGSSLSISNGGDVKKGKQLAETCLSCHNDDSDSNATNPRLAGQHANYLEKAMKDYKSGERKNPIMQSMVGSLSEEEMKDIAAYFTSLKGLVATK